MLFQVRLLAAARRPRHCVEVDARASMPLSVPKTKNRRDRFPTGKRYG
ncbi:hypothetical protein BURMUCF1_A0858 [Burkholderia multivorans ATCC BAA-247]|nr:hypothetical protein BURMUCF1_A0858 [Burkholderia multivorans ATCC BAA-247]